MDPTYTGGNPGELTVTTSGLALDYPGSDGVLHPILYDPRTMSTPWTDENGVLVATQADGSILPVAVSSDNILSNGLPSGVTNILTSGLQSLSTQFQHWLNPVSAPPMVAAPSVLGGMSPTTLLLLGVGAYFLFFHKSKR